MDWNDPFISAMLKPDHVPANGYGFQASERLPHQIFSLRLEPELKNLCRRLGLKLSGRRAEVIDRIQQAWNNSSRSRDTVRAALGLATGGGSVGTGGSSGATSGGSSGIVGGTTDRGAAAYQLSGRGGIDVSSVPIPNSVRCCCTSTEERPHMLRCAECGCRQHSVCMGAGTAVERAGYVCAVCRATWLDPFHPVVLADAEPADASSGGGKRAPREAVLCRQYFLGGATPQQLQHVHPANTRHIEIGARREWRTDHPARHSH
jgi:hypothetical protein